MKTRISKAYRGKQHIGWKKTVAGREWFLGYGITPSSESKAIALATVMEAKWQLKKAMGHAAFTETDFQDCKEIVGGRGTEVSVDARPLQQNQTAKADPPSVPVRTGSALPGTRRWLHAAIHEVVSWAKSELQPDVSNGDHVINTCERLLRALEASEDQPLDLMRRKQLDEWLQALKGLKSKLDGRPLGPVTSRVPFAWRS